MYKYTTGTCGRTCNARVLSLITQITFLLKGMMIRA